MFQCTKNKYPPGSRHKLTEGLLEKKSSKHSKKCRVNPQETRWKYAVPFAGIVVLAYLKDREFVYTQMSIDKSFGVSEFRSHKLILDKMDFFPISTSYFNCCA